MEQPSFREETDVNAVIHLKCVICIEHMHEISEFCLTEKCSGKYPLPAHKKVKFPNYQEKQNHQIPH
jgi:hypothetical protein